MSAPMSTPSAAGRRPSHRGARRLGAVLALMGAAALGFWAWVWCVPYPLEGLERQMGGSTQITDRDGKPLRDVLDERQGRSIWVPLSEHSKWIVEATLAGEDHRFEVHKGVDPWAVVRAVEANVSNARVYSGASTLTMQLVRLLEGRRERSWGRKAFEAVAALRLEQTLTARCAPLGAASFPSSKAETPAKPGHLDCRAQAKAQVLEHYLNSAPYGNGTHGVEAASWRYFGRRGRDLSLAQAALLAALPRSPSGYNPHRHLERAQRRQRHILGLMRRRGTISKAEHDRAVAEPLVFSRKLPPFEAPHFVDHVLDTAAAQLAARPQELRTTIDLALQREVQHMATDHTQALEARLGLQSGVQAAVVVLDNATGQIRAWVGSRDWSERQASGQVNGPLAQRQPGSLLKPITYALSLERGMTAATVFPDVLTRFSLGHGQLYTPQNFDRRFRGPVRMRQALAGSLNVPAVRALEHVGADALLERLNEAGVQSLKHDAAHYGLGLTLGDGEMTLLELVGVYAAFARGGLWQPTTVLMEAQQHPEAQRRVFSPQVAHIVTDMLSDGLARAAVFGTSGFDFLRPVALKTGTSAGHRDSWVVGYTPQLTVGVWVGRFDGGSLRGVSGAAGAGPLFTAVMKRASVFDPPEPFERPGGLMSAHICPLSGQRRGPHCPHSMREIFRHGHAPAQTCQWHQQLDVDTRNGLLATPNCPERHVHTATFTAMPDAYNDWALAQGLKQPPAAHSPLCANASPPPPAPIEIVSPTPAESLLIDPSRPTAAQTIRWAVRCPPGVSPEAVRWRLNEAPAHLTAVRQRGELVEGRWALTPGRHVITAVLPDGRHSESVHIEVR